jgi:general secretion pathway protein K
MRPESGFALALVLWVMVLLSVVGISLGYAVRVETAGAGNLAERVQAEALAAAAVRLGLQGLLNPDPERQWQADGRTYDIPWAGANLRVTMRAESGKIDLNRAPEPLLAGLFGQLMPDADAGALAAAVIDWRDRDDRRSDDGAEASEYRAAGRRGPANGPFERVSELAMVLGFDADSVALLAPHLTVYSGGPRIDPFSAGSAVLASVPGIGPELAERFVAEREALALTGERPDLGYLAGGGRYLDTRTASPAVGIRGAARLDGGAVAAIEATVDLRVEGRPYAYLDWRPLFGDPLALATPAGGDDQP